MRKQEKRRPRKIRGSGGDDPPQQHIPSESPNTLQSRSYIRIQDLIAEGEIVGLVGGKQGIFIDDTPLRDPDIGETNAITGIVQTDAVTRDNFANVDYVERTGTQDQLAIEEYPVVEGAVNVSVEVKYGVPVIRQVTNPSVERLKLAILFPALQATDTSTGDVRGLSVALKISVQPDGGSYTEVISDTVTGKSSSQYERSYRIPLAGDAPWNIKIERLTGESDVIAIQDKFYLKSYTEVIDAKLRYPNSAMIGIRLDAQQFSNVPKRAYLIDGLIIKVPANYEPEGRVYDGEFDGTFHLRWSDNPAWVFYDLCTSPRYGLGAFVPEEQIDIYALYQIAQYCDELVPDGFGGTEPRFRCNLVIETRAEAYTILQNLASVFRGMIYWGAGTVVATQDSPQDALYLYTPSNVVDGLFNYEGASAKTRHSVALITWNDPANLYKQSVEYVEDQEAIASFGVQQAEVVAFGCTSRGQAHRLGKWLLYTEQNESEIISFKTGMDGAVARPGQIIKVADPVRAGIRMGGRISSATVSVITVDQDLDFAVAGNTLSVLLLDGTVEDRTAVSQSGREITVQPDFSEAPQAQSIWVLRSDEIEPQTFRVLSVKEDGDGVYSVSAIKHDSRKFDAVEQDLVIEPRSISALSYKPASPMNLKITEALYQTGAEVKSKITVSWSQVAQASQYIVRWRFNDDNFVEMRESQFNEQEILDTSPGTYTVQVVALNPLGRRSLPAEIIQQVFGKSLRPSDVIAFSMIPNNGQAYLSWSRSVDLDVLVGGKVRIRHSIDSVSATWNDAIDIIPAVPGTATSAFAPLLEGTYMAKFVDSSGNYSVNESIIVTTIPYPIALNVVQTEQEDPDFPGVKTDMQIDPDSGYLVLASGTLVDDYPLVDDVSNWEFSSGIAASGTYDFENTIDLGGVWPSRIYSEIALEAFDIGNVIDSRIELIDTWDDIDGDDVNDVNAELFVRTTEDDPSGSPTWTDWKRISAGAYLARGLQFQLRCTSGLEFHNLKITSLKVTIDMEDRTFHSDLLASGLTATYRVDYDEPFFAVPSIGITAQNMGTGDFFQISSSDETGFDIVFKNAASTIVDRTFSVIAKGYGRLVA